MTASKNRVRAHQRVAIVGAGFAGLNAAKHLRNKPVDVTIVDRNNYHRFQPLLYQVATAGLEPGDVAHNVRDIFRGDENITFRLGTVRRVDHERRRLHIRSGEPIEYEYLILAAGAVTAYFGVEGARTYGFPLKNLPDAIDLRNHILRVFERVERNPEKAQEGALTIVVVGGGPTGIETAGALVELFRVMRKDYRRIDTSQAKIYLVEMLPDVLPSYAKRLRGYTRKVLEKRGVKVMTDTTVARVSDRSVILDNGCEIATNTLIWAAGVRAHPLAATLGTEEGKGGRLVVDPDLRLPDVDNVFVVGDMAGGKRDDGEPNPQLAPVAVQQGNHAARQVLRLVEGKPTEPFEYDDPGRMATIGRHAAVTELPSGITMKGYPAWLVWVITHIAKLVGFRNRLVVFVNWIYNYFTYDRSARLIMNVIPVSEEIPQEVEHVEKKVKPKLEHLASP